MKTPSKYSGRKLKKPDMRKEGNFTQIPNAFILNPDIRDPELRLLLFIMMNKENRTITTKNCISYLQKSKPAINGSFEKLIASGILKITDETIEIIIPDDMKKYTLGYLQGKESLTIEVKNSLPTESPNPALVGKENLTVEVKKTLPSSKENLTPEVKNSFKKPLDNIDNVNVTDPIILNNNRVLPVPAASGSTGQSHSNNNTKGNTGIEMDLECVSLTSARIPSGVPQTQHTPKVKDEKESKESSSQVFDSNPTTSPTEVIIPSNHSQTGNESHSSIIAKNDLELVLENVEYFKVIYDNANWGEIDISSFSNAYISKLVFEKEKNIIDERIASKTYFFLSMLIQYSSLLGDDSELWKEFQRKCNSERKTEILLKHTHPSIKTKNQI